MTVLVTAGSRHGATYEIAEAIGRRLEQEGVEVDVKRPQEVDSVDGYDAVVLGGATYIGGWVKEAREFARAHAAELAEKPVWVFSSGPLGEPPKPDPDKAVDVAEVVAILRAREHRLFSGRLDMSALGLGERAVVAAVRAPEGDFRDWPALDAWAHEIATALATAA